MRMIPKQLTGIFFLCVFFVTVIAAAVYRSMPYPLQATSGESSAGTWLSGVLLAVGATCSLINGMQSRNWKWYVIALFFLLLAADEHFMFHERLKEWLIFTDHSRPFWFYEAPVLIGAAAGVLVAYTLARMLQGSGRLLLFIGAVLGSISVIMDVLAAGVLFEDVFKLLAELTIACALLYNKG
ncbi:hypothetical protein WBG78_16435 [Chryseolinea sp. T2]|uniref:hypothetical protein n=1 Tax=Chryseolinea sp. T2 TaxID=3129255 RepID=UPI0030787FBF